MLLLLLLILLLLLLMLLRLIGLMVSLLLMQRRFHCSLLKFEITNVYLYVVVAVACIKNISESKQEPPVSAAVIGGVVGGGAAMIIVAVIFFILWNKRRLTDSVNNAVYETAHTNTIYSEEYDELSQPHANRKHQADVNTDDNDASPAAKSYELLDADRSSKNTYASLSKQQRAETTRHYENTHEASGTAEYLNERIA
ncbi:hypothetical protein DPMN_183791 [Dreissena polymorpha]|uniref:Uncharacterized protein n=1 Tax=Dreissena polymorpha TaxID=45954 RepID=A0A9D4DIS4_DREPO|nr:hypothetical protein DPMN_183791 [Dreissena polymorpha]